MRNALLLLLITAASGCHDAPKPTTRPAPAAPLVDPARQATRQDATLAPSVERWTFDGSELPRGWTSVSGRWEVTSEHALRQTAESSPRDFNVVLSKRQARDLDLSVRFRAISGKTDRGGGVVWRAKDAKNYYIARFNPLEKNFRVYTVKNGVRSELASENVGASSEVWHTLEVRMQGDHFEGKLDGKKHLDVRDATFTAAGAIGLWTKADAVTDFDDLELRER